MKVDVREVGTLRRVFDRASEPNESGEACKPVKYVWNLAAPLSVEAAKNPQVSLDVTVGGMKNILTVMREFQASSGVKMVLMFTDSIGSYGGEAPRKEVPANWLLSNPKQDPGSDYGRQKRMCREVMKSFTEIDTRFAVVPGVLHAEADWGNGTTEYALDALMAASKNEQFPCPIEQGICLPMIYAEDLVRFLLLLARAPSSSLTEPEAGYAAAGFSFTPRELVEQVRKSRNGKYKEFSMQIAESNINPIVNKFATLWPDSLSPLEAHRDFGFHSKYGIVETVDAILLAHEQRTQRSKL